MIKKSKYLAALTLALAATAVQAAPITSELDPALAGSTLIDFESALAGEYLSLVLPGVTINGNGGTMTICTGCGGGNGAFGDIGQSLQNTGGSPTNFDLVFDSPVSAFGIIGGALNGPWTYTAYDIFNNVIEVLNITDPCCGGFFRGIAANGIARVNLNGAGDWVVFENLRFTTGDVVPEPGTLALLGLSLGGLAWAKRRAKN